MLFIFLGVICMSGKGQWQVQGLVGISRCYRIPVLNNPIYDMVKWGKGTGLILTIFSDVKRAWTRLSSLDSRPLFHLLS